MAKAKEHKSRQQGRWNQGMTYCLKFTILYKDFLVMKADSNFSKMSTKNQAFERLQEVSRGFAVNRTGTVGSTEH